MPHHRCQAKNLERIQRVFPRWEVVLVVTLTAHVEMFSLVIYLRPFSNIGLSRMASLRLLKCLAW